MDAAPGLTTEIQSYAPDLARRVGFIVVKLCLLIGREAAKPHLFRLWLPLCRRLCRIVGRFRRLMECLAGRLPRRGPHTGGAPHPENLLLGVRLPTSNGWLPSALGWEAAEVGWNLEQILAEPGPPRSSPGCRPPRASCGRCATCSASARSILAAAASAPPTPGRCGPAPGPPCRAESQARAPANPAAPDVQGV